MTRILILCTGNSCRSQMAQAFLASLDPQLEVVSAGTHPSSGVHPMAIEVMKEIGFDLSHNYPKKADEFLGQAFDYVITVCDGAKESCPVFTGKVIHRIHIGFDDPAEATGTEEEIRREFRKIRDKIRFDFSRFYDKNLNKHRNQ